VSSRTLAQPGVHPPGKNSFGMACVLRLAGSRRHHNTTGHGRARARSRPFTHDINGDWQFVHATKMRTETWTTRASFTLGHVVEFDSSVAELATLPHGWRADRDDLGAPWIRGVQTISTRR